VPLSCGHVISKLTKVGCGQMLCFQTQNPAFYNSAISLGHCDDDTWPHNTCMLALDGSHHLGLHTAPTLPTRHLVLLCSSLLSPCVQLVPVAPRLHLLPRLLGEEPYRDADEQGDQARAESSGGASRHFPRTYTFAELLERVQVSPVVRL